MIDCITTGIGNWVSAWQSIGRAQIEDDAADFCGRTWYILVSIVNTDGIDFPFVDTMMIFS